MFFSINGFYNVQPFIPGKELVDKSPQMRILADSAEWETPIGLVCLETIYNSIPSQHYSTDISSWPNRINADLLTVLKNNLLQDYYVMNGETIVHRTILNEELLSRVAVTAYHNFRSLVGRCAPKTRPLLLDREKNFDVHEIIRKNVERDPLFNINAFIEWIRPLTWLKNQIQIPEQQLLKVVSLLQATTHYLDDAFPYRACPGDGLYLLVLQLCESRDFLFINKVLQECASPDALNILNHSIAENSFVHVAEGSSSFSQFVHELHTLTQGKNFKHLINGLKHLIKNFQSDERKKEVQNQDFMLWFKCGDIIHGIFPTLFKHPQFDRAKTVLDALPLLTSHASAISMLSNELAISLKFGEKFYKTWWYSQYLQGKKCALSDRLVDWLMHQCLVDEKNWGLTSDDAVHVVKKQFRDHAPLLPFNLPHAENRHFLLVHAHRKSKENHDNSTLNPA